MLSQASTMSNECANPISAIVSQVGVESSGFSPFFLMYGREANAKHMILAEETTKYLGDNEGVLNVQLMTKLLQVVAYNLAKSRTA